MNSKSTSLGFITYYPNSHFYKRIDNLLKSGYELFLFDNSPHIFKYDKNKINYYFSGNNIGLGKGLKIICSQAYKNGFANLIFFDQDTVFNIKTLEIMTKFFNKNKKMLNYNYSSIVFNSENYSASKSIDYKQYKNVLLSRNSGSLFILKNLKKIGWHNENYFVDGVDYEYNYKSAINNFKIASFSQTPGFDHDSEQGFNFETKFIRYPMRKYSLDRIKDYLFSNLKILLNALFSRKYVFAFKIFYQLAAYIFTQMVIRMVNILK